MKWTEKKKRDAIEESAKSKLETEKEQQYREEEVNMQEV